MHIIQRLIFYAVCCIKWAKLDVKWGPLMQDGNSLGTEGAGLLGPVLLKMTGIRKLCLVRSSFCVVVNFFCLADPADFGKPRMVSQR